MPTRSDAYELARDVIVPELRRLTPQLNGDQFLLREIAHPLIENAVTPQDRDVFIPFQRSLGGESFIKTVKWYVYNFVRNDNFWVNLGGGNFRNRIEQDIDENELQESALEEGDETASEYDGWIYAYTFPAIQKADAPFPIKVGKTMNEVDLRVRDQVRGAALFENPIILASWQVHRVAHTEMAIHYTLKARGLWIDDAPGREWFKTTLATLTEIITNIRGR